MCAVLQGSCRSLFNMPTAQHALLMKLLLLLSGATAAQGRDCSSGWAHPTDCPACPKVPTGSPGCCLYIPDAAGHVNWPASITEIPDLAFQRCSLLVSINIPNTITRIGQHAFSRTNLASLNIPNSVTTMGLGVCEAVDGLRKLVSVTLGSGLTEIPNWMFKAQELLTSVSIPNGVNHIGTSAFHGCSSLGVLYVKTGCTFGSNAFEGTDQVPGYIRAVLQRPREGRPTWPLPHLEMGPCRTPCSRPLKVVRLHVVVRLQMGLHVES